MININMKINELTGYKSNDLYNKAKEILGGDIRDKPLYASLDEWEVIMKQYGFIHLGTGSYGSAYEHPNYPWVFKVFKNDKSYFAFFNYARRNQNNPNLPKIKGSYIKIGPDAYAVRLEKLQPMSQDEWIKLDKITDDLQEMVAKVTYGGEWTAEEISLKKQFPGIYEIISAMWNADIFKNSYADIHSGNIMMRGDVPVFIDPVVD